MSDYSYTWSSVPMVSITVTTMDMTNAPDLAPREPIEMDAAAAVAEAERIIADRRAES